MRTVSPAFKPDGTAGIPPPIRSTWQEKRGCLQLKNGMLLRFAEFTRTLPHISRHHCKDTQSMKLGKTDQQMIPKCQCWKCCMLMLDAEVQCAPGCGSRGSAAPGGPGTPMLFMIMSSSDAPPAPACMSAKDALTSWPLITNASLLKLCNCETDPCV